MYLLFLDESGTPVDDVFALGGVAINAADWRLAQTRWTECLEQAGWPRDRELKWSGTQSGEVSPGTADARPVDSPLPGPSHHSLGLQPADLVVGCTRAATFGLGDNGRRLKQLERVFARHPSSGEISGVGLKCFPDSVKPEQLPGSRLFDPRGETGEGSR
jgi:hypothetical protein